MKAKLNIVKIDETEFWDGAIQKRAGKIFAYYMFDELQETYCCELTPSYYLIFLYNRVQNVENFSEEELTEIEMDNGDYPIKYVHTNSSFDYVHKGEEESFDEYEEFIEREKENFMCNNTY